MRFIHRHHISIWICAAALLCGAGDASSSDDRVKLVVWGTSDSEAKIGYDALIEDFERHHPGIKVVRAIPERGDNLQKLLCAVVGDSPPDVFVRESRFLGNLAARGILRPLDDLIERDLGKAAALDPTSFYPGCWNEMIYEGRTYAVPDMLSPSVFVYNKHHFREAGLDPERPPRTWDELLEYTKKLVRFDDQGRLTRIGFMPFFWGMDPLVFYIKQNGGRPLSLDGRTCLMNSPEAIEALEFQVKLYDLQGGARAVTSFFKATGQAFDLDPLQMGKVSMVVDDDWVIYRTARYGKPENIDLGLGLIPTPTGEDFISYQRGGGWCIPSNARNVDEAWTFIKWITSPRGVRAMVKAKAEYNMRLRGFYYPGIHSNERVNREVLSAYMPERPDLNLATRYIVDEIAPRMSAFPPSPVSSFLWHQMVSARDAATYGAATPEEALNLATANVNQELRLYFKEEAAPLLNWSLVWGLLAVLLTAGIILLRMKSRRVEVAGYRRYESAFGYLFISPWIIGFLVFTAGPIIISIIFSLCEYDVIHPARFVGLANYRFLLTRDPVFWKSLFNTLYMVLGIPLGMAAGLGIAMLLNSKARGMTVFRTIYYLPAIVPVVASSILWIWLLNPEFGLINQFIEGTLGKWFGIGGPGWLQDEKWSKPAIILMGLWGAGASMIIWLAGLKGIPQQLYEAAAIDGAGAWRRFSSVTLPMLSPYIFFNIITGIIGTFQIFTQAVVMTQGGPVNSTLFYVYYLFNNAFSYFKMGYASAMAWILFAIILALTLVQIKLAPRWVHYEGAAAR